MNGAVSHASALTAADRAAALDPKAIRAHIAELDGPEDLAEALCAAAARVASDPTTAARFAVRLEAFIMAMRGGDEPTAIGDVPASQVDALVALATLPGMQRRHRALSVPAEVTRDTQADALLWLHHYRERHGDWGLAHLAWLRHHLVGRLYRLGRLQFMPTRFAGGCSALRPRAGGTALLLAAAGLEVRADGFLRLPGDGGDGTWRTAREDTREAFVGAVLREDGGIATGQAVLPAPLWEQALTPGDEVLEVHIPAGEPMDHQACSASFGQAARLFAAHHPEVRWRAFATETWLLDAQLARLLPAESNIVRFLSRFRLYPTTGGDAQALERVFDARPGDGATLATGTSLQRVLAAHLRAGGRLRAGGGIILRA